MTQTDNLAAMLDIMCPLSISVDQDGRIRRVGPTLQKLRPDDPMPGRLLLDFFEIRRPRNNSDLARVLTQPGERLDLRFRDTPRTELKGVVAPSPDGEGAVINMSFGISVLDAVRDYSLTSADFPVTDLTIEMLYLVEAKSAAMEASRKLNLRLRGAMIAAEEQAFTDTLTGLRNRRALDVMVQRLIDSRTRFSLMQLDLDFFKQVNDTLGHAAGDHVLQCIAEIMHEETRESDIIARVGGDEFVIVLNGLVEKHRLSMIARKLISRISKPIPYGGAKCRVSASIGTVRAPETGFVDIDLILHQADLALYAAKRSGRATHVFYSSDMDDRQAPMGAPVRPARVELDRPARRKRS
ncbi:diguanylate cyclase [Sulfitobacter sp. BDSS02]|nr:diguanylate cyclase [Sulfitobacter sp. BDSS02]MBR9849158.1 diguanylate cyclase [Paracoccaceae bacterium]